MRDLTDHDLERLFELDDGPGPARPIDEPRAQAILAAALGRAGFSPPGGGHGGGPGASAATRAGGRAKLAVLSGGAVVLAIVAVAWIATRSPSPPSSPSRASASASAAPNSAAPPSTTAPDDPGSPSRAPASASAAPNSAAPPSTTTPATEPPTERATEPPATEPPTAGPGPPRPPTRTPPARAVDHRRPPRAQPAVAATLDDLLAQANAARAAHRWRAADALYGRVVADGPATLAVQTALVASASIHLEHFADPAGAARRFADALAAEPRGALAEEARWGLAEAARAQADRVRELRALDDFLAHHPGSVLAAQARARRAALGAPP